MNDIVDPETPLDPQTYGKAVPQKNMIKIITDRLLMLLVNEINKPETQKLIRQKILAPVITLLYNELYPYIIALVCVIMVLLVLSVLTFTGFLIYYLKNL